MPQFAVGVLLVVAGVVAYVAAPLQYRMYRSILGAERARRALGGPTRTGRIWVPQVIGVVGVVLGFAICLANVGCIMLVFL